MLNKSKGNMYHFIDYTWNPVKGECNHNCSYCYMKVINPNSAPPRLVESEFTTNLGKGNSIFVGSSTDMFAENIPSEWINKVLDFCYQCNDPMKPNTYLLQSKNPKRFLEFIGHPIMKRVVFATTIETNRFYPEIFVNSPKIEDRANAIKEIAEKGFYTMITAEPLLAFDKTEFVEIIRQCNPRFVNIGRESMRKISVPEPTSAQVKELVAELREVTKVIIKSNAKSWLG